MPDTADFIDEFTVIFGVPPLGWQRRLFSLLTAGEVPAALDLPTGLGKTSIMAIWLIARAHGASLPRRLVYVVDRRVVVDQATTEAEKLRKGLERLPRLKTALSLESRCLPISTLRGQFVDNREWQEDPCTPVIIIGTVDMIGSRLLFSGYGVSPRMRPYHAGLLGVDVLVALDEAHLVPPFEKLLETIETGGAIFGPRTQEMRVPPFKLLSLSATGRPRAGKTFRLEEEDCDDFVRQRLDASKRLKLEPPTDDLASDMAERAWERSDGGRRVIIFCNSRKTAQKIYGELEKKLHKAFKDELRELDFRIDQVIELIVGARRVHERDQLAESGVIQCFQQKEPEEAAEGKLPAFLVCTSAGEVGVDLNADHMVCDLVPWERMVQRFGRVNRSGSFSQGSLIDVFAASTEKDKEAEIEIDREWIENLARPFESSLWETENDGRKDASPDKLRTLNLNPEFWSLTDAATTNSPLRPGLTRPLVDAWSMTSLKDDTGRPNVAPWLRGWVEEEPQTAIIWRRDLPVRETGPFASNKEIQAFFEAAPPHMSEKLETETWRVVEWLLARANHLAENLKRKQRTDADDVLSSLTENSIVAIALGRDGTPGQSYRLGDLVKSRTDKKARDKLENNDFPGVVLIVDARLGGLNKGLLDGDENAVAPTPDSDGSWLHSIGIKVRQTSKLNGADGDEGEENSDWRFEDLFPIAISPEGEVTEWLVVERLKDDASANEDGRAISCPQSLEDHSGCAVTKARRLAHDMKLEGSFALVLEIAARLHDEGKKSWRWQRAFNAPSDGPIYAKTKGPINQALLDGYRHEFGSLASIHDDDQFRNLPDDGLRDLVLHLVAAHHGRARPMIETKSCDDAPPSVLEERARDVALRFARLQKLWGPWGLAWWEALLRAVDQQASRENGLPMPLDEKAESGEAA